MSSLAAPRPRWVLGSLCAPCLHPTSICAGPPGLGWAPGTTPPRPHRSSAYLGQSCEGDLRAGSGRPGGDGVPGLIPGREEQDLATGYQPVCPAHLLACGVHEKPELHGPHPCHACRVLLKGAVDHGLPVSPCEAPCNHQSRGVRVCVCARVCLSAHM